MRRLLAVCGITVLAGAVGGCACGTKRCYAKTATRTVQVPVDCYANDCEDLIGPRGPSGPTGLAGERGPTGQMGAPGYAVAGERGPAGERGYVGEQGRTGATGAYGTVVRGRAGAAGPTGQQGAPGSVGATGVRGESAPGFAGQAGVRGPAGPAGPTGETGVRGPVLEGPTGPAGYAGATGARGTTGFAGAPGQTTAGVAGPTGPAGPRGPEGTTGETGFQGAVGTLDCWTSYREIQFRQYSTALENHQFDTLAEVATYMKQNPSLDIGIDGTVIGRGTSGADHDLANRRVNAVRSSLIEAGVSPSQIKIGAFGEPTNRRDGRVELLIITRGYDRLP